MEWLIRCIILFFSVLFTHGFLGAQNTGYPDSWGQWKRDIILTSQYLGPNALPVPEIRKGIVNPLVSLEINGQGHYSKNDKTLNPFFKLNVPIAERVSIEVWSPFVEFFQSDTASLRERNARNLSPKGYSGGDIYVATIVQVLKDHSYFPDVLVSVNLKTASGDNLEALRHTDTPGYYFDLSVGKDYEVNHGIIIKPYGLLGFYVYQTHQVMNLQNDAFLWGTGVEFSTHKVVVDLCGGGYHGYFNQGDRPVVARLKAELCVSKLIDCSLGFQLGLNDFPYKSANLGVRFKFPSSQSLDN